MSRASFDYQVLKDAEVAKQAKQSAKEIHQLLEKSAETVVKIGQHLLAMKAKMTPVMFNAWFNAEFGWVNSVAFNYMQAATTFAGLDCLKQFQPTAIINLSRKSIPEEVVSDCIDKARKGEIVTSTVVSKMLKDIDHKPAPNMGRKPNPESPRSIIHKAVATVKDLTESLDSLSASINAMSLQQAERQSLAEKFMEMANRLMQSDVPASPTPATTPKAAPASKRTSKNPSRAKS